MPETSRHSNGGGLIIGVDSAVSSDSYLSVDSQVEGRSFISYGSTIQSSAIRDSSLSFANIAKSALINSHVAGAIVSGSGLEDVVVRGTKERLAVVRNCLLSGEVAIEGCTVQNLELNGPHLIHRDWLHRAPRTRILEHGGVRLSLAECGPGNDAFHVGCEHRQFREWDYKEPLLFRYFVKRLGWPEPVFRSIRTTFEEWRAENRNHAQADRIPSIAQTPRASSYGIAGK